MAIRFTVSLAHTGCDHAGFVVWEDRDRADAPGESGPVVVTLARGFFSVSGANGSIEILCAGCGQTVAAAARGDQVGAASTAEEVTVEPDSASPEGDAAEAGAAEAHAARSGAPRQIAVAAAWSDAPIGEMATSLEEAAAAPSGAPGSTAPVDPGTDAAASPPLAPVAEMAATPPDDPHATAPDDGVADVMLSDATVSDAPASHSPASHAIMSAVADAGEAAIEPPDAAAVRTVAPAEVAQRAPPHTR
jgi:hypothetical protein